jgi:CHASE2 domain-containing sensor protein
MTLDELPKAEKNNKPLDAELRKDLTKSLILAFPMLLLGMVVKPLTERFNAQPAQALFIIIPGLVILSLIFLRATTRQKLKLGWPFLVFLPVYILIFFIAAQTGVLDWNRSLVGYETKVPRNFLALNRYGDWHYAFATEKIETDLAIVLMKHAETIEESRLRFADLIGMASESQAKGVALDYYFAAEEERIDEHLCSAVKEAKINSGQQQMPIFVSYDSKIDEDGVHRLPIDPNLEKCLPSSTWGHTIGYAEWDGRVRSIPLELPDKSLSLKIAQTFDPQVRGPKNGLVQFIKPANDFKPLEFEKLWNDYLSDDPKEWELDQLKLRDKFILVGEDSVRDHFWTPYGIRPGVVIHAYAVHSLKQNHFIERASSWVSLLMITLLCYLMMVLTSLGVANLKLILINVAFSAFIVAIAILSMYVWLTWIDLVYPLLATWLFLLVLMVMRRIGLRKARSAAG